MSSHIQDKPYLFFLKSLQLCFHCSWHGLIAGEQSACCCSAEPCCRPLDVHAGTHGPSSCHAAARRSNASTSTHAQSNRPSKRARRRRPPRRSMRWRQLTTEPSPWEAGTRGELLWTQQSERAVKTGVPAVLPTSPARSDPKGGRYFVYRPGVDGK
jgi:hypothetical protein